MEIKSKNLIDLEKKEYDEIKASKFYLKFILKP